MLQNTCVVGKERGRKNGGAEWRRNYAVEPKVRFKIMGLIDPKGMLFTPRMGFAASWLCGSEVE